MKLVLHCIAFVALLLFLIPVLARATPAPQAAGADQFVVGTLHVTVHGDHGTPLILIPGLGSGAWVWQGTIDALADEHRIYALTLAGFNCTPAPAKMTDLMGQAKASLLQLIKTRRIEKPVLVGHSLGGTLAIAFAEKHSELLAGVVAVDGMPVFPMFARMSAAQRQAAAERMKQRTLSASPEQFRQQQIGYMTRASMLDPTAARHYGKLQARSNPKVVAQFMYEDLSVDLRPDLGKISVPLLEIMPWNKADLEAAAKARDTPVYTRAQSEAFYAGLLQGVPQVTVVSIAPARHFVMLDQPEQFMQVLTGFLERSGRGNE